MLYSLWVKQIELGSDSQGFLLQRCYLPTIEIGELNHVNVRGKCGNVLCRDNASGTMNKCLWLQGFGMEDC